MQELYKKVTELFEKDPPPGHDIKHALRVAGLAKKIAGAEGYDAREAEIAGLLHDVGRTTQKDHFGHAQAGVPVAKELLNTYTNFSDETKERILSAIKHHSDLASESELAHILQDADKLDGIGAVGISRAYVTCHALPDYDPNSIIPDEVGEYGKPVSIHQQIQFQAEWYNMLFTETAKEIGKSKYEFMKTYLDQIKKEIEESTLTPKT